MTKILPLVFLFSLGCATIKTQIKEANARHQFSQALKNIKIEGDPVELTMKLLDEANEQMGSHDLVKIVDKVNSWLPGSDSAYQISVDEETYPGFQQRFPASTNFVWKNRSILVTKKIQYEAVKIEAGVRVYKLKRIFLGSPQFVVVVEDAPGNKDDDGLARAQALVAKKLAPQEYAQTLVEFKKRHPQFAWND